MCLPPPRSTPSATPFPYTMHCRSEVDGRFGLLFDFGLRARRQTLTGVEVTHLGRFPASVLLTVVRAAAMQMARDSVIDLSKGASRLADALTTLKMQQTAVPTMEPT